MSDKRRQQVGFRIPAGTAEHLKRRARDTRETQSSLVERYVLEGLRTDDHPLIHFREGASGRRPALVGTRLDVWQVIETLRQNENSIEATAEYLGVPVEKVRAALRYYAEYQEEIDDWTAQARAIAEREEKNWRRQQELLA